MEIQKLGPVVPISYPRVTFRIAGEQQVREFNPASLKLGISNLVDACQQFVNLRCRPLLRLDGYKPEDRSFVSATAINKEVDFFYSDHPLVEIK
jgi:hypothetical protein